MKEKKRLLIIFVRNPQLGKVKTRLAAWIGTAAALKVYQCLLKHISEVTRAINVVREIHFSEEILEIEPSEDSLWEFSLKKKQEGKDLGERMELAFQKGFQEGYQQIVLIGSDIPELQRSDLEMAYSALEMNDYVIGPAGDGGYYLIGMKSLNSTVFKNKTWSTSGVLRDTLQDLENDRVFLLEQRNDLDTYEDLRRFPQFSKYHINKE